MTADQQAAVDRVRAFVAGRERHHRGRRRAEMFGAARNPMPQLICAEYGTLDVADLTAICDALDPP